MYGITGWPWPITELPIFQTSPFTTMIALHCISISIQENCWDSPFVFLLVSYKQHLGFGFGFGFTWLYDSLWQSTYRSVGFDQPWFYTLSWIRETWGPDDIIKWKHFPCYWPFVRGIHRSTVNSPHKGQWRGALTFSLICVWINGWVNNCEAGDLRCYCAHYDVIVMHGWMPIISREFKDIWKQMLGTNIL